MRTAPQPATAAAYNTAGTVGSCSTHVWARCDRDPRLWVVLPLDPTQPVYRAVADDFGMLVPVGGAQ